jgi:pSer/pThr/pTyr-binding forkhead associated (FHA) protein
MTTQTAHPDLEAVTDSLEARVLDAALDALPLLDHRTRDRAIAGPPLRAGHYLAVEGGEATMFVRLDANITHIGRGIAAHIRLEDPRVSRTHAIIVLHGRYARILDNRSANGTFLNGRRITATNLEDRDVIRIGPVAMVYVTV